VKYAKLGRSDVEVSRICLGTNNFGGQLSAEEAAGVVRKAIDLGINFVDTANVYTDGHSEEVIGRTVKEDRGRIVIATKVGAPMPGEPESPNLSKENILSKAEESLKRLQTSCIDLYYLHVFDPSTPLTESLLAMNQLVKNGKVRHYGVSNYTVDQLRQAIRTCDERDLVRPIALQPRYNLLVREAETDLFPYCIETGLGVATYSPLQGGLLTGKYSETEPPPPGSRAAFRPDYWGRLKTMGRFKAVERLRAIAKGAGAKPGSLAIAWVLRNRAVSSAIVGASSPAQVEENCAALELKVPESVFAAMDGLAQ
jgi:aryl-alcohol dehydrogenase-like predicted oxidoreductase